MKSNFIAFIGSLVFCCNLFAESADGSKAEKPTKTVDVDKIKCSWNKTPEELEEHCNKPKDESKSVAKKLDGRLKKDAKTIKKFFNIDSDSKNNTEE